MSRTVVVDVVNYYNTFQEDEGCIISSEIIIRVIPINCDFENYSHQEPHRQ